MDDADFFRRKAERCRLLSAIALKPEIKEQLRMWAREFEDLASDLEERKNHALQEVA